MTIDALRLYRYLTVEQMLRLKVSANAQEVEQMATYFEVKGANRGGKEPRSALTRIELKDGSLIIPDCVFSLKDEAGVRRLFVLEMYNQHRTQRMSDKLIQYCQAIQEQAIERTFSYPHSARILVIFEDSKALELYSFQSKTKKNSAKTGKK